MTTISDLTMRDLLKDPMYRAWLKKPPPVDEKPFRLMILSEVDNPEDDPARPMVFRWGKSQLMPYSNALSRMLQLLRQRDDIVDLCVCCPARPTPAPTRLDPLTDRRRAWMPEGLGPAERWCPYCRRYTRFGYFKKHHAIPKAVLDIYQPRCVACGAGKELAQKGSRRKRRKR